MVFPNKGIIGEFYPQRKIITNNQSPRMPSKKEAKKITLKVQLNIR